MSPSKLYATLLHHETSPGAEPDARRVLRNERQALHVAMDRAAQMQRSAKYGGGLAASQSEVDEANGHLDAVAAEAERVARMWGAL